MGKVDKSAPDTSVILLAAKDIVVVVGIVGTIHNDYFLYPICSNVTITHQTESIRLYTPMYQHRAIGQKQESSTSPFHSNEGSAQIRHIN